MRKFLIITASAVAFCLAFGSMFSASAGTSATATQTIRLVARQVSATLVPVPGQKGHQLVPGDQLVFTDSLTRNGANYGHDAIHCVIVIAADAICAGAFSCQAANLRSRVMSATSIPMVRRRLLSPVVRADTRAHAGS